MESSNGWVVAYSISTAQFEVEADLIRISVGLEDSTDLVSRFERALAAASKTLDG
ncbi:MAG: hypothetical protein Q9175_006989 [Cornicularia normoerica]